MLVYGDRVRIARPGACIAEIRGHLSAGRMQDALLEAGELLQGLADHEMSQTGVDDDTPLQSAAVALAVACAAAGRGGGAGAAREALHDLRHRDLPSVIRCREPEGFAFYAVYPEAYAAAAAAHRWSGRPLVLGLRSIGATLGAAVAAAVGGRLLTLRPVGHPFRRTLAVSPRLRARIAAHDGPFAVVDEGPGLSGSSFGCVAELLEDLGVSPDRTFLMPSHPGAPGSQASPRHLALWRSATRIVGVGARDAAGGVLKGLERDLGPIARSEELSGGAWRQVLAQPETPADPVRERRKLRLWTPAGVHVARYAGLGRMGRDKRGRAEVLHAAGFVPAPIALRHGFLVERWADGSRLRGRALTDAVLPRLADYLRLRREAFPAPGEAGADAAQLVQMGCLNAETLCGGAIAGRLVWSEDALQGDRAYGDGRLHAWEWRAAPAGAVKLDALDHACGHDLVGAQPAGWDVAGAVIELGLDPARAGALAAACAVPTAALPVWLQVYAAFQGGLWSMAEQAASPREARRIRRWRRRYAEVLRRAAHDVGWATAK